jgi:ATP-dependent protease ClpP protease subunit
MRRYECGSMQPMEKNIVLNDPLKVVDTDQGRRIDFYLTEVIETIDDYIDFLRAIESCRAGDEIVIHINCYGGNTFVSMNIHDALLKTDANVKVCVEGICASAATDIMLAANEWEVSPHATVMVHSWSAILAGKWSEIKARFHFDEKSLEPQFRELYKDFMSDEEIEACLNGKDFWFNAEETIKRLEAYTKEDLKKQEKVQEITSKYEKIINAEIQKVISPEVKAKKGGKK